MWLSLRCDSGGGFRESSELGSTDRQFLTRLSKAQELKEMPVRSGLRRGGIVIKFANKVGGTLLNVKLSGGAWMGRGGSTRSDWGQRLEMVRG